MPLLRAILPILSKQRASFKLAQHDGVLALLNEGDLGATQVGKFITIYPESDDSAYRLAEYLIARTRKFSGPEIVTDLRLGAIVYARYGSFSPVIKRNRLGYAVPLIEGADGDLVPDRYSVPFAPPVNIPNPFTGLERVATSQGWRSPSLSSASGKLIAGAYLVVKALKIRPYGGALLAIDLRAQETVALKVLKFGRPHCLSDAQGRDMRDRLKKQAVLHAELSQSVPVPKADPYFEVDGDGYVAIEYLDGRDFEHLHTSRFTPQPWHCLASRTQRQLLRRMEQAIGIVQQLHAAGYIHRDLSPSNIWLTREGKVYLLDLELAYPIGGSEPAFGLGTEGFMSPQQLARASPAVTDDVFAIGCLLALLLTRLDPRRVVFWSDEYRRRRFTRLVPGLPEHLLDVVCSCLADDPDQRPTLAKVKTAVAACAKSPWSPPESNERFLELPFPVKRSTAGSLLDGLDEAIKRGQRSLIEEANERDGLWLSARSLPDAGRAAVVYEVERHANRGVAGVVYLLSRLARYGYGVTGAKRTTQRAVNWLLDTTPNAGERLPGLHFGEAGVAVAIAEAIDAGYVVRNSRIDAHIRTSLGGTLDWPDMTHGASGQGIAAIYCAQRLGEDESLHSVHRCVDFLLTTQAANGSWVLPAGIDGLSGQTLTGFAHGTAGIVLFLAEYQRRFKRREVDISLHAGTTWLISQAKRRSGDECLEWRYGTHTRQRWHWWCHGGPGIALTFLKLFEYSGDRRYADIARNALIAHPAQVRYSNLTQCHGLSGLGEIYLEAARVLGESCWQARATQIADELLSLARKQKGGGVTWLTEDPRQATADLMVGYSGILHFFLRFKENTRPGYPLLLDPSDG
ncbi:MAG: putative serine/threonine protein kinase [Nevskia sp.]|nr:putative serine/threonine protein kinase [Nevskia sp.]